MIVTRVLLLENCLNICFIREPFPKTSSINFFNHDAKQRDISICKEEIFDDIEKLKRRKEHKYFGHLEY